MLIAFSLLLSITVFYMASNIRSLLFAAVAGTGLAAVAGTGLAAVAGTGLAFTSGPYPAG